MIFRSLKLSNYGRFDELELRFQQGLTVVKGPNEAGKSTVQSALMLALFGDPRGRSQPIVKRRRWGQDRFFRFELEFNHNGAAYRLERDYDGKTELLVNLATAEQVTDRSQVQSIVSQAIGVPGEEILRATACVTQDDIARISDKGKKQISEQLQSVVTGGAEDAVATQAVAALQAKAAELRRGLDRPASNPGAIKQSQDRIARIGTDLAEKTSELANRRQSMESAERAAVEFVEKSERLQVITGLLERAEKRAALLLQRKEAAAAEESLQAELDEIERLTKAIGEGKSALREFEPLTHLSPDTPQELASLQATLQVLSSAEETAQAEVDRLRGACSPSHTSALRTALAGVVLLIASGVLGLLSGWYVLGAVGLAAAGGLLFWRHGKSAVLRDIEDRIAEAEKRQERSRIQLEDVFAEQQALVKSAGCETADELAKRWTQWSQLRLQSAEAEAELAGRLRGRAPDSIEEDRKRRSRDRRDAEDQLDTADMRTADLTPLQRQQYALDRERLTTEIAELQRTETASRALAGGSSVDPTYIYALEEELGAEQDRLRRLDRLARSYAAAAKGIEDALTCTLSGAKDELQKRIGQYLSDVTGGKYNHVEVDERSLDFRVYSSEKGGTVEISDDELSRGTLDQFYLAARIALLDLICGQNATPILLDDPFVTFDDERTGHAMQLCKQISRRRQILLFTCSNRYDAYADDIIDMSARTSPNSQP